MPIAHRFLSTYKTLKVSSPVFTSNPPTLGSLSTILYKRYSSTLQTPTKTRPMVQDWPLSKFLDIQPASYVTNIELPVLIDKNGLRMDEILFFEGWLDYMTSTCDTIMVTNISLPSLVVESATINVGEEITLSLSFKSNFKIGWGPVDTDASFFPEAHTRVGKYYDTFVQLVNYSGGVLSKIGWENTFGISNFSINYKTEIEELCLSQHEFNISRDFPYGLGGITIYYPHIVDMINSKFVTYEGELGIFGASSESGGVAIQQNRILSTFEPKFVMNPVTPEIFSSSVAQGGIQIYVGEVDVQGVNYNSPYALTMLPTGIVITEATEELAGRQVYKHTRKFQGVFTNSPRKLKAGVPYPVTPYLS